jgi:sec-independent protein translocase protein TatA
MFGAGHWEILIIFLVILLIFGAKRIPEMAQGLGKGIKEFRKAMRDVQEEIQFDDTAKPASRNQLENSVSQPVAPRSASSSAAEDSTKETAAAMPKQSA